jgi:peptidoglycan/xylan/chitin deacetylase (PgdA/CDA1 family)
MPSRVHSQQAGATAALGAALAVAHVGPSAVRVVPSVSRVLFPRLHGVGRPDHLALTFDDGPDPRSTPAFLDALANLGWTATFFMLGDMVRGAPGLAAEVTAAGHEIGVHADEHRSHLRRPPGAVLNDLTRAVELIEDTVGSRPFWFRPPYGAISSGTVLAARRLRLRMVLWTSWGKDWRDSATPLNVAAEVERGLAPGATVVLHDSDCASAPGAWRSALGSLPLLADLVEAKDWKVGPLRDHGVAGS